MRKKLDGFNVFSNGETEDIKEAHIEKKDLQSLKSKLKYDLRKSLAWDSAFSTSSGIIHIPVEMYSNNFIVFTFITSFILRNSRTGGVVQYFKFITN